MTELVERCILKCAKEADAAKFRGAAGVVLVISHFVFICAARTTITELVKQHEDAVVTVTFEPRAQACVRAALGGSDPWLPEKPNNE